MCESWYSIHNYQGDVFSPGGQKCLRDFREPLGLTFVTQRTMALQVFENIDITQLAQFWNLLLQFNRKSTLPADASGRNLNNRRCRRTGMI